MRTPAEVLDLFRQQPPSGSKIDWLVEEFLSTAAEAGSFSLAIDRALDPPSSWMVAQVAGRSQTDDDYNLRRQFRTVLARMAKMGADEGDAEFQPYGGHVVFNRDDNRIEVDFENTSVNQRFSMLAISLAPDSTLASDTQPALSGAG